jgi:hypothetical protein
MAADSARPMIVRAKIAVTSAFGGQRISLRTSNRMRGNEPIFRTRRPEKKPQILLIWRMMHACCLR